MDKVMGMGVEAQMKAGRGGHLGARDRGLRGCD